MGVVYIYSPSLSAHDVFSWQNILSCPSFCFSVLYLFSPSFMWSANRSIPINCLLQLLFDNYTVRYFCSIIRLLQPPGLYIFFIYCFFHSYFFANSFTPNSLIIFAGFNLLMYYFGIVNFLGCSWINIRFFFMCFSWTLVIDDHPAYTHGVCVCMHRVSH